MKTLIFFGAVLLVASGLTAENRTIQKPITMEQLMAKLRILGGNWAFTFDRPVYAKVVCIVSSFPDGKTTRLTEFVSDTATTEIALFFTASGMWVGDYPKPDQAYDKEMVVKLSNCAATAVGARVVHYVDKFALRPWIEDDTGLGEFRPSLPLNPELNQEYVLHDYFKEGDPYEAKATICFLADLKDAEKVRKFDRHGVRTFKEVGEAK